MNRWFECKVKYVRIDEQSGKDKKVSEVYLIDAVSFTDAECRINSELEQLVSGEFQVTDIKKAIYSDVFMNGEGDRWYKCKIKYSSVDESAGKEKQVTNQMLILANDLQGALENLSHSLSGMMVDYVITSIVESTIVDVIPYKEADKVI
ncbi:DUF4494 domain-containing protein [Marinilabiliaceae bacterium ANBcel2]|nr:DUF4494 domain-containing protein [Marinilabiliaceae bacterium ANBcel2]